MKKILLTLFYNGCILLALCLIPVLSGCDDGGKKKPEVRLTDAEIMKLRSDSLYKVEGDTIFGNFRFGMSRKEFDTLCDSIKKEFSENIAGVDYPLVRIAGYDMLIRTDSCYFYNDSLYLLNVSRSVGEIWYMFSHMKTVQNLDGVPYELPVRKREDYEYDGTKVFDAVEEGLEKKYGEPNSYYYDDEYFTDHHAYWFLRYKDILVSVVKIYHWEDDDSPTTMSRYNLRIKFVHTALKEKVQKKKEARKKKLEEKREAERKREQAREDSINKKKESFAKGL